MLELKNLWNEKFATFGPRFTASALQGGAGIEAVGAVRPDNLFTMVLIKEVLLLKGIIVIDYLGLNE